MVLFGDLRYFNNCGGDIENLITQIASVNNERSIGKHPLVNIHHLRIFLQNMIWKKGLEMFKFHKAEQANESWNQMFG